METTMTKTNGSTSIFESEEFGKLRIVMIEGEPYFVGRDVAEALGYAKPENAIANHVDQEDKTTP